MFKFSHQCWRVIAIAAFAWLALAALTLLRGPNAPGSLASLTWQTESKAKEALDRAGASWAQVHVRDGVMIVAGPAPDERARQIALNAAREGTRAQFGFPGVYYEVASAFVAPTEAPRPRRRGAAIAPPSAAPAPVASMAPPVDSAAKCQDLFQQAIAGQRIQFATGSAQLPASAYPLLNKLSVVAGQCAAFKIAIGGHTDTRGDPAFNKVLSEQRAASVLTYLAQHGATRSQLAAIGYGASRPISTAATYAAHQQNRRITFDVSGP